MNNTVRKKRTKIGVIALMTMALTIAGFGQAWAFSNGPPNGRTNAPGEGNCTACHTSFSLNSGTGTLSVSGLSGAYVPGQSYDLLVELADPDASRWGFEFTVIGTDGNEIGSVTSLDGQTQTSSTATRTYAKHTSLGTQSGTTVGASWTVRWTAPLAGNGDATIYIAGNAANGNGSSSGDRIYAINETWMEDSNSPAPLPVLADARLMPNYPNPFNPMTRIAYELEKPQAVRLTIYSVDGRVIRYLEDGYREAGDHIVQWNGTDHHGLAMPSGTYFYRLQANGVDQTRSMVLIR